MISEIRGQSQVVHCMFDFQAGSHHIVDPDVDLQSKVRVGNHSLSKLGFDVRRARKSEAASAAPFVVPAPGYLESQDDIVPVGLVLEIIADVLVEGSSKSSAQPGE